MQQSDGTDTLTFSYDADGLMLGVKYNGENYYYIRNLQGDVIGLYDSDGNVVVNYVYDSWGKVISVTGSLAATIGVINPIRYCGYYYDTETGLYYLQSRYYNPEWCRFINSDELFIAGDSLTGANMFVYCFNNPVMYFDPNGYAATDKAIHDEVARRAAAKIGGANTYNEVTIYYNKNDTSRKKGTYGMADIVNMTTGAVWEVKKDSRWIWHSSAVRQLNKYIGDNCLASKYGLTKTNLKQGGDFLYGEEECFDFVHDGTRYIVTYWYKGDGIIRYDYMRYNDFRETLLYIFAFIGMITQLGKSAEYQNTGGGNIIQFPGGQGQGIGIAA